LPKPFHQPEGITKNNPPATAAPIRVKLNNRRIQLAFSWEVTANDLAGNLGFVN
jgi:hypothetical protein